MHNALIITDWQKMIFEVQRGNRKMILEVQRGNPKKSVHSTPLQSNTMAVKLISGRSNRPLAQLISDQLNVPLTRCCLEDFSNSELKVEIQESVRGSDIFIIQTGSSDADHSVNDYVFEAFSVAYACKLSGSKQITLIVPYYPYSRSDKKDVPRAPINAALFARLAVASGVNRIISMDLHAGQIQGFVDQPFDNLYAINHHIAQIKRSLFAGLSPSEINERFILVSPDCGGIKRAESYSKLLQMNLIIMHKQRDYTKSSHVINSMVIGDTKQLHGKIAIVIDDIVDTLGTMVATANELAKYGVLGVHIVATHGILSGPALTRLNECEIIKSMMVTNTLDQTANCARTEKLVVVDVSDLIAEVIHLGDRRLGRR